MYNKDNHTGTLEQELAKWECIIDRIICPGKANLQLQWHLEDPKERKLSPGWKKWTYCNGLKWADNVTWNKVLHLYEEKFDATILEYLTCSINRNIIINYLEITLEKIISMHMSYYRPEQGIERLLARESAYAVTANVFLSILARNTRYILKDILRNFKKIKHRRVSEIMALTVIINNIYTKEQLDE
ncbi:aminopeptidase n, partial [Lasius niger]